MAQIRDVEIQKDSMRYRRNIERIGEIMAYEISRHLEYKPNIVTTPLGTKEVPVLKEEVVICSILRAGLAMHGGFLNFFDDAKSGFISAYRRHNNDGSFEIDTDYKAIPPIDGKNLIIVDPMLATGLSLIAAFSKIMENHTPESIHIAVVLAAPEGIIYAQKHLPDNYHLWIASEDEKLNEHGYIIPGLGDAGDLAYGARL